MGKMHRSHWRCCRFCPPRWVFSGLILVLYLVFFGCSLSYSWIYVFDDPQCNVQTRLCNMQLIGCILIMVSLCVFGANLVFHLINFKSPNIQRQYIRIMFLVPVLCAQSWVLMFAPPGIIIAYSFFAESYKTFSLYCVLHLFLNYLWENCNDIKYCQLDYPFLRLSDSSSVCDQSNQLESYTSQQ